MPNDYLNLVRATISSIKELKSSVFSTQEEWQALHCIEPNVAPAPVQDMIVKSAPKQPKKEVPEPQMKLPAPTPPSEAPSAVKSSLLRLNPTLHHVDQIPDDAQAKRILNGWREYLGETQIVVLSADTDPATLELLKNLAKAIDQKLGKVKAFSVDRLEREKRWDLFLKKNNLKLIVASEGFNRLKDVKHHLKSFPANSTEFLGDVPLIVLSPASYYMENPKEKSVLWGQICQILQR